MVFFLIFFLSLLTFRGIWLATSIQTPSLRCQSRQQVTHPDSSIGIIHSSTCAHALLIRSSHHHSHLVHSYHPQPLSTTHPFIHKLIPQTHPDACGQLSRVPVDESTIAVENRIPRITTAMWKFKR